MKATYLGAIALVALIAGSRSHPVLPPAPAPRALPPLAHGSFALVGVHVLSMKDQPVARNQTIVVRNGIIAEIGPAEAVAVPEDAERIEAAGRFVVPGLMDMHVHLREEDVAGYLGSGVTTVRNMWGDSQTAVLRARAAKGETVPTIFSAGPGLDGNPPVWPSSVVLTSADQAAPEVAREVAAGWDFIKVYNRLEPAVYHAILAAARAEGVPVVGHVPLAIRLEEAMAGGQASIEHMTGIAEAAGGGRSPQGWTRIDRGVVAPIASRLARSRVSVCPTLVILANMARHSLTPADAALARENQAYVVAAMHQAGVRLIAGTDAGLVDAVPAGESLISELELFVRAGLTPLEALRTATTEAAAFLGIDSLVGSIEVGKRADLVVLLGNPLDNIAALRNPAAVILGGRILNPH
ncbi:MAG: amidohydrolase family protein [Gemmatimonadales bacterium]